MSQFLRVTACARLLVCLPFQMVALKAALAQRYTVTEIPSMEASYSVANSINDLGQIAGWYYPQGTTEQRAFFYSGGVLTDLGTIGGATARADALNNNGQVVGTSGYVPFLFSGGSLHDLSPFVGLPGNANGINDSGVVVGQMSVGTNSTQRAFKFAAGSTTDLGTLPGGNSAGARAINNQGKIVGLSHVGSNVFHAFLSDGTTMQDLGTLGGTFSIAYAINDNDEVVGYSHEADGTSHAFLYKDGVMLNLDPGGLGISMANSINNSGQIVGSYAGGEQRNFLYENGVMFDLNTLISQESGWILDSALGINDAGQIVGVGTHNGNTRGYLLTPVPEPGAFALGLTGAVSILLFCRRKNR
jgi:probable HAF family extracellular repeat protein